MQKKTLFTLARRQPPTTGIARHEPATTRQTPTPATGTPAETMIIAAVPLVTTRTGRFYRDHLSQSKQQEIL